MCPNLTLIHPDTPLTRKLVRVSKLVGVAGLLLLVHSLPAFSAGSVSGTLTDPSGATIPGASVLAVNTALQAKFRATSDSAGFYSFPSLPVGHYDLIIEAHGFQTQRKTDIGVDADSSLRVDAVLVLRGRTDEVSVTASAAAVDTVVETAATHLGEVVQSTQMEALPLNGRAYTDLLAIQPGVTPVTTLTSTSVIMAGVTGTINPSGDLNPGDVSIDGQRESANGFMVNGIDVQEHMNGGTSVIPNLDSIQEFRVLTNNFDPEYGNYNGGMINVETKSGSNAFHGDAFEFLRNTALDARNYFSDVQVRRFPAESVWRRHRRSESGKSDKVFFFSDYQGTRTVEGIASSETTVLSLAERSGNFNDAVGTLTGTVGGPYAAGLLTKELGYGVDGR